SGRATEWKVMAWWGGGVWGGGRGGGFVGMRFLTNPLVLPSLYSCKVIDTYTSSGTTSISADALTSINFCLLSGFCAHKI
ncbi:MAG: hypothetical protein WCK82_13320, partial [Bacteroidota bacterium]